MISISVDQRRYVKVTAKRKRIIKSICWECTGSGRMAGNWPCKICMGTGLTKEYEN